VELENLSELQRVRAVVDEQITRDEDHDAVERVGLIICLDDLMTAYCVLKQFIDFGTQITNFDTILLFSPSGTIFMNFSNMT